MKTTHTMVDSQICRIERGWEFPEYRLPDWEVRFCVNYEYARESQEFISRVNEIRARKPRQAGSPFDLLQMEHLSKDCWVLNTVLARRVPEFPKTPWLAIPEEHRACILEEIGITECTGGYGFGFVDRGHPDAYFMALGKQSVGCINENASFVLEFNFREHDAFIIRGFSRWLAATRAALLAQHECKTSPYRAVKHRKGKRQNISIYRQALKDLSFLRRERDAATSVKGDPKEPKAVKAMIQRAEAVIACFSEWGTPQKLGYVESLIDRASS